MGIDDKAGMYHNLAIPEQCTDLWQQCHDLVTSFITDCPVKNAGIKYTSKNPLLPCPGSLYLLKEGVISEKLDDQLLVIYEAGDLINADAIGHAKITRFECDFAVLVDEYDLNNFLKYINNDKNKVASWYQFLSLLTQSFQLLFSHYTQQVEEFLPDFRIYKPDEVIIEENTEGTEVYTLVSGSARVMINDQQVGEIQKDEIFGAIAALTQTLRNASVIANTECTTIVVNSDNFRSLLTSRPDTVQKLVNDMARTIVSCNERIIELSAEQQS